jgi:hypothetical protein
VLGFDSGQVVGSNRVSPPSSFPFVWVERIVEFWFKLAFKHKKHFPLLLDCGVGRQGKGSFKFENMWLQVEGFEEQVKRWWGSYIYEGTSSYVFARKLKSFESWPEKMEWGGIWECWGCKKRKWRRVWVSWIWLLSRDRYLKKKISREKNILEV